MGRGKCSFIGAVFTNCLGLLKTNIPLPKRAWIRAMAPTHPHGQVENTIAPSAGGSPDPEGKARAALFSLTDLLLGR